MKFGRLFPLVTMFGMVPVISMAENIHCPAVVSLPATLNITGNQPSQPQLRRVQAYLDNIRSITQAYHSSRRRMVRNHLTNCMIDHLYSLPLTGALQSPRTAADTATWQMLREEVYYALNLNLRHLPFKPEAAAIIGWLETEPPRTLASR